MIWDQTATLMTQWHWLSQNDGLAVQSRHKHRPSQLPTMSLDMSVSEESHCTWLRLITDWLASLNGVTTDLIYHWPQSPLTSITTDLNYHWPPVNTPCYQTAWLCLKALQRLDTDLVCCEILCYLLCDDASLIIPNQISECSLNNGLHSNHETKL